MRFTLFLMTEKGFLVLKKLVEQELSESIDLVIVGIDKSVRNDFSSDIISLCQNSNLPFRLSSEKGLEFKSSYGLAVSWRWLIDIKNLKLIVLHDSILPKYRGFSPLVNSLLNQEKYIGVSAIFASEKFDRGPIILQKKIEISYPIKIQDAIKKIVLLYQEIVVSIFRMVVQQEEINSFPQDETLASYSLWRNEEDYRIDWNNDASYIKRFVDAVGYPYNGACCFINDNKIIVNEVEVINDFVIENRTIGKVLFIEEGRPFVVCKTGIIRIDNACFEQTKESIIPFKFIRTRFK
ncbi:methionyl-tRNA formyltransferase [Urechidicola sp. KH5]